MAALNRIARDYATEIREGIGWVLVWKTGRSWHAAAFWLDDDDHIKTEDLDEVREILATDPNAVMLNGYYCGHFGEDMTVAEIAAGIRWNYDGGHNTLANNTALPDPELETPAPAAAPEAPDMAAAVETIGGICTALAEGVRRAAAAAARIIKALGDVILHAICRNPRYWQFYTHAKKKRIRNKYRNRILRDFNRWIRAGGLEVIT